MRLHHTSLSVKNLETTATFYKDVFGFVEAKRFERPDLGAKAMFLKLHNSYLEIWELDNRMSHKDDLENLNIIGYKHIAFEVDDIQKTYEEMLAKGLNASEPKQGAVAKYIFIKDPNG